ncbi:hypothetical protein BT69DRAFT_1279597 [Atractiella rhizophila]|nr:hypothetical protein BT69DRAFT_1279597 [Atractiella rhizophila]
MADASLFPDPSKSSTPLTGSPNNNLTPSPLLTGSQLHPSIISPHNQDAFLMYQAQLLSRTSGLPPSTAAMVGVGPTISSDMLHFISFPQGSRNADGGKSPSEDSSSDYAEMEAHTKPAQKNRRASAPAGMLEKMKKVPLKYTETREERLEKNRISASKSRQKKKAWVEGLNRKVQELNAQNEGLRLLIENLKQEKTQIQTEAMARRARRATCSNCDLSTSGTTPASSSGSA